MVHERDEGRQQQHEDRGGDPDVIGHHGSFEEQELGDEDAERRQADERQNPGGKERAGPGHRREQARNARELGRVVAAENPARQLLDSNMGPGW